jgi:hypothetical protein
MTATKVRVPEAPTVRCSEESRTQRHQQQSQQQSQPAKSAVSPPLAAARRTAARWECTVCSRNSAGTPHQQPHQPDSAAAATGQQSRGRFQSARQRLRPMRHVSAHAARDNQLTFGHDQAERIHGGGGRHRVHNAALQHIPPSLEHEAIRQGAANLRGTEFVLRAEVVCNDLGKTFREQRDSK